MKHIHTIIILIILVVFGISVIPACKNNSIGDRTLTLYASDTTDVYAPLKPNENWITSRHTYGRDSILGHKIKYRMTTDSNEIFIDYDFTVLEIHPKITANLLSFLHGEMLEWGFISEKDSITPWSLKELVAQGLNQQEIVRKIFDWESENFYKELPDIYKWESKGFNLDVDVYPVFINEDYITFRKFAYYYTGGAHGNHTSFLQTYNLKTGETVNLEDIIKPDKYEELRKKVVAHMASSYPIYEGIYSTEQYLDSLNRWLGKTDIGVVIGVIKENDLERITEKNYPINDPGINETGLVITYEKYHLTPGADGVPKIVLTYDEIRDCLQPPYDKYKSTMPLAENNIEDDDSWYYGDWYDQNEKDSIRNSMGLADNGKPFPIDIYDQYVYRNGNIKKRFSLKDIEGLWIGYGRLYDPRHFFTLKDDGSYTIETEEALNQDERGNMRYDYASTIRGNYKYDSKQNRITLLNQRDKNSIHRDDFVKYEHPEHKEFIVQEINDLEMILSDEQGDRWSYYKIK